MRKKKTEGKQGRKDVKTKRPPKKSQKCGTTKKNRKGLELQKKRTAEAGNQLRERDEV